jgi:hypothetical protein
MKAATLLFCSGTILAGILFVRMDSKPAGNFDGPSFRSDVLPILVAGGCTNCHGDDGGLDVSSVRALLAGGDGGPVVVPGNADSSGLIRAIVYESPFGAHMPPDGPPLSAASVKVIRAWINGGAKEN